MEFVVLMTLPGLVILLTVLAFADQLLLRAGRAGVLPCTTGGLRVCRAGDALGCVWMAWMCGGTSSG
ncbi:hypothetical protein ACWEAF_44340, partial [Streptomyces sp. NPDC005071]